MGPTVAMADEEMEEAEDDEDELDDGSGVCCKHCGCELALAEEVFLARVVRVTDRPPHLVELSEEGYLHQPAFFCFDCWEERLDEVETRMEDIPPIMANGGIATCDICGSDILPEETMAVVHFGEIHWSKRAPDGVYIPQFIDMQSDKHLCLGCVFHLNQVNEDPIWEDDIEPIAGTAVCMDGLFSRCWRHGNCTCPESQRRK